MGNGSWKLANTVHYAEESGITINFHSTAVNNNSVAKWSNFIMNVNDKVCK